MAGVVGRPRRRGKGDEPFKQEGIVSLIRRAGSREPRRIDARRTAEGVHHESTVFREHPAAQGPGLLRGLESRVGGERITRFLDIDRGVEAGERAACDTQRGEQFGELAELTGIGRAEHERRDGVHRPVCPAVAWCGYQRRPVGTRGTSIGLGCTSSRTPSILRGMIWPTASFAGSGPSSFTMRMISGWVAIVPLACCTAS